MSRTRRALLVPVAAVAAVVGLAAPVAAHVHPDPAAVEAGAPTTVSIVIEHGCEGAPTTGMSLLFPEGTTDIASGEVEGFTATAEGLEALFTGGSVPDGTEQGFPVSFTPPSEPGDAVIKVVQTCGEDELAWIDEPLADGSEPESPAPVLTLTDGPPTEGDLAGHEEEEASGGHDEGASGDHESTEGPAQDETAAAPRNSDSASEDDDSSAAPILLGIGVVVIVGVAGAVVISRRRVR